MQFHFSNAFPSVNRGISWLFVEAEGNSGSLIITLMPGQGGDWDEKGFYSGRRRFRGLSLVGFVRHGVKGSTRTWSEWIFTDTGGRFHAPDTR